MITEIRYAEDRELHYFTNLDKEIFTCDCGSSLFRYRTDDKVECTGCGRPHIIIMDKGA